MASFRKLIAYIFLALLFLTVQCFGSDFLSDKKQYSVSEVTECASRPKDEILAVGEITEKTYFYNLKQNDENHKDFSYLAPKDKVIIYSSYDSIYCVGVVKNDVLEHINYGFISQKNVKLDDDIKDLSKYIGEWQYDNGEVSKTFKLKSKDAKLYIDTYIKVKALNHHSESSSTGSGIYFDENAKKFKIAGIGLQINYVKYCSDMYYNFYNYYDYLVVAYKHQVCAPRGNIVGIYKKIEK